MLEGARRTFARLASEEARGSGWGLFAAITITVSLTLTGCGTATLTLGSSTESVTFDRCYGT